MLYLIGVVYLVPLLWWPVARYDEGVLLSGAQRMLAGELPYRDFWTIYGPGQFAVLAALFTLGGRIALGEPGVGDPRPCAPAGARLPHRHPHRWSAGGDLRVGPPARLAVAVRPDQLPGLPRAGGGARGHLLLLDGRRAMAGALVGVAALFRQDLGAYAALAHVLALGLIHRAGLRDYALGLVAISVPAWLLLALAIPWRELVADLLTFPATVYPLVRRSSAPAAQARARAFIRSDRGRLPSDAPAGAGAGLRPDRRGRGLRRRLLAGLATARRRRSPGDAGARAAGGPLPAHRPGPVGYRAPGAGIGASRHRARDSGGDVAEALRLLFGGAAALLLAVVILSGAPRTFLLLPCAGPEMPDRLAARAGGACMAADQAAAVVRVDALTSPSDRIFVAATAHDRVLAGDASFYFLVDRLPGTHFHELHPGLTTTADVQEAIVTDLERNRVPLVVRVEEGLWEEPNASRMSSGVDVLDRYLDARFVVESRVERYSIYRRTVSRRGIG